MTTDKPHEKSGADAGVSGVVEDVKGKAKEAVGAIAGNERLKKEGQAQQDKAASEREAAKHEARADAERAKADAYEAEQRARQER